MHNKSMGSAHNLRKDMKFYQLGAEGQKLDMQCFALVCACTRARAYFQTKFDGIYSESSVACTRRLQTTIKLLVLLYHKQQQSYKHCMETFQ